MYCSDTWSISTLAPSRAITTSSAAGVLSNGSPFGFMLGRILSGSTTIDMMINALEQRGVARTLAEPNLVALSGDTASFLAGGEFPIPVAQRDNEITVEFKKFGVSLDFSPTVLSGGRISLKVRPEVSELTDEGAV